jgi:hypothetical protein
LGRGIGIRNQKLWFLSLGIQIDWMVAQTLVRHNDSVTVEVKTVVACLQKWALGEDENRGILASPVFGGE